MVPVESVMNKRGLVGHADRCDRRGNRGAGGIGEDFGVDERERVRETLLCPDECFEGRGAAPSRTECRRADVIRHRTARGECLGQGHVVEWAWLGGSRAQHLETLRITDCRCVEAGQHLAWRRNSDRSGVHDLKGSATVGAASDSEGVEARCVDGCPEVVVRRRGHISTDRRDRVPQLVAVNVEHTSGQRRRPILNELRCTRGQRDRHPDLARDLHVVGEPLDEGESIASNPWVGIGVPARSIVRALGFAGRTLRTRPTPLRQRDQRESAAG